MQQKLVMCPKCFSTSTLTVGEQFGGKIALGLVGAAFGKVDPWLGLAASVVGIVLGHVYIDNKLLSNCPQCGQLLIIANSLA
jgi:uncharacterized membrane protein